MVGPSASNAARSTKSQKLLDIAGPWKRGQYFQCIRREMDRAGARLCAKMFDEQTDVFTPRPKWRQCDHTSRQPMRQVGAERSGLDTLYERQIGGRYDTKIAPPIQPGTHRTKRSRLQCTQQFPCDRRECADLVENAVP